MKIILIIIFSFITLNAQSEFIIMMSGGAEWVPTDVDGNTLAYYDGDVGLTTAGWEDQFSTHDIVFTNSPTIVTGASPTRDAVRFNGTDESGVIATPTTNQPYTIYIVVNSVSWASNDVVFDDGVVTGTKRLYQATSSPNLNFFTEAVVSGNPDLAIGTWGVMTVVVNGASSELRTNLEAAVTSNQGTTNSAGITIAARTGNSFNGNIECAYLIIRTGADATATQNIIINNLATLCGLTF